MTENVKSLALLIMFVAGAFSVAEVIEWFSHPPAQRGRVCHRCTKIFNPHSSGAANKNDYCSYDCETEALERLMFV